MVIILPEGRAKQIHLHAGQLLHVLVAFLQLLCNFLGRNPAHVWVCGGVVAQIMPLGGNFLHLLGIFFHPIAAKKKRRLHVIFLQNPQQLIRIIRAPCRIKADRNLRLFRLYAINRQPSFPLGNGKNLLCRPRHAHIRRRKQQQPQRAACRPFFCDMYPFPKPHTKFPPCCFFLTIYFRREKIRSAFWYGSPALVNSAEKC